MNTATHGTTAVDWETRVDHDRLRRERVQKLRAGAREVGAGRAPGFRLLQHPVHVRRPTSAPGRWTS